MRYLIGVDDTDNSDSPGTAAVVRRLAEALQVDGLAEALGITRHQLLQDRRIPFTSRNSSACVSIETENAEGVWETGRDFLRLECAAGSNVGLCLSQWDSVGQDVVAFGRRAKAEVVALAEAQAKAAESDLLWAGLTGSGGGLIGALAAIGLHRDGNDGRFLWLPGLQELQGKCSVAEIFNRTRIDRVCSLEGEELSPDTLLDFAEGAQAVLRNGQATLYVEQKKRGWRVVEKDRIKKLSN